MELDDTHLCLRCGKTIEGLDNYVSHRQQQCYKFQPPSSSPFFSDTSESLTSVDPPVQEFPPESHDIYKLSASDFFLSLNLQSNFKSSDPYTDSSNEIKKESTSSSDNFCSRLEIPSLENDLAHAFPDDKPLCCDGIVDEQNCIDINNVGLSNEKWDSLKCDTQLSQTSQVCSKNMLVSNASEQPSQSIHNLNFQSSESLKLKSSLVTDSENKVRRKYTKKKALKKYGFTNFSALNIPRSSYRQKLNANDSMLCCEEKPQSFICLFCDLKYSFVSTYLDHLLICSKKMNDLEKWEAEVFKNEHLFIRSSHFKCLLCSFYCSDSFMFLNHLKSPNHRQNAAILKTPLICLPCQDECSASDEMKEHFSKCHLQYTRGDHPIIVTKKKRNLHCCYCLSLVKSSTHLQSNDIKDSLLKEDITFLKTSLHNVCSCGCGVEGRMLNTFLSNTSSLAISKTVEESKHLLDKNNPEISSSSQIQKQKIPKSFKGKPCKSEKSSPSKTKDEDKSSLKTTRKRIVAKITSQNGKFIYKKMYITNSKRIWVCCWCRAEYFCNVSLQAHLDKCGSKNQDCHQGGTNSNEENKSATNSSEFYCDKCPYVGKSFNQLTRHSRSHSGEKPYKCPHCNYSSSLSSQLVRHKRLHTGKKPYKCPYCSYSCNTQENLRKHILKTKKHKGKRMYPCHLCDFESNEFSDFKSHLLDIHSVQFPNGITNSDSPAHAEGNPGL